MADLSPAGRAVLYDAHNRWLDVDDDIPAQVAAAALRAAANNLKDPFPTDQLKTFEKIQSQLLSIAAELEAHS